MRAPSSPLRQEGFTLIELLVVVGLIAILSAIAIPTFILQRQGAGDAASKTAVSSALLNALAYYHQNDEDFTGYVGLSAAPSDCAPGQLPKEPSYSCVGGANGSPVQAVNQGNGNPNQLYISGSEQDIMVCAVPKKGSGGFCLFRNPKTGANRRLRTLAGASSGTVGGIFAYTPTPVPGRDVGPGAQGQLGW